MNKATLFAAFLIGSAIGSAATWFYAKKKYEQIAREEIKSVKEVFSLKKVSDETTDNTHDDRKPIVLDGTEEWQTEAEKKAAMNREKPSIAEYAKKLSQEGYFDYSTVEAEEEEDDEESDYPSSAIDMQFGSKDAVPFVIPPEQFGEFEDYGKITLTYYSDHILVDENDEMIEDVEGCVGFDSLNHFGEYEDDSVHVQNDRLKTYYEILMDNRRYTDVLKSKPYLMED